MGQTWELVQLCCLHVYPQFSNLLVKHEIKDQFRTARIYWDDQVLRFVCWYFSMSETDTNGMSTSNLDDSMEPPSKKCKPKLIDSLKHSPPRRLNMTGLYAEILDPQILEASVPRNKWFNAGIWKCKNHQVNHTYLLLVCISQIYTWIILAQTHDEIISFKFKWRQLSKALNRDHFVCLSICSSCGHHMHSAEYWFVVPAKQ